MGPGQGKTSVRLKSGDVFPASPTDLMRAKLGHWVTVLFDHGNGCPHCRARAQLVDFERHLGLLRRAGVDVPALSRGTSARSLGMQFLVPDDVQARQILDEVGRYVDESGAEVHTTVVIVNPNGHVALAVYASGANGHLSAVDALSYIEHLRLST